MRQSCCGIWRASIPRTRPRVDVPVPDYEAAVGQSIKGLKVGVPKEYRIDGMPQRDRGPLAAGHRLAEGGRRHACTISRCRTPKYALPAYYIVAPAECSSNLARYDGVRYGLRKQGRRSDRYLRERRARQASAPRCAGAC